MFDCCCIVASHLDSCLNQLGFEYKGRRHHFINIDKDSAAAAAALKAFLIETLSDASCYVMHHPAAGPAVGVGATVGKCIDFTGMQEHLQVQPSHDK